MNANDPQNDKALDIELGKSLIATGMNKIKDNAIPALAEAASDFEIAERQLKRWGEENPTLNTCLKAVRAAFANLSIAASAADESPQDEVN